MSNSDTKYGDLIADDQWESDENDQEPESANGPGAVKVSRHSIVIEDQRDAHGYEYGLRWQAVVENGTVTMVDCGHWLEGHTQWDPMGCVQWSECPLHVRRAIASELGYDDARDVPLEGHALTGEYGGGD